MGQRTFEVLILIGRPASGKSEIIAFLEAIPSHIRARQYRIAKLDVIDDFPMIWTWFEEDHILSTILERPRIHTDDAGYFRHNDLWNLLIEKIGLEYYKRLRDDPVYHDHTTAIVEFARGSEHGGYAQALGHLSDELLVRAAILYVHVSYKESLRKNRRRYNPERPDSILEHSLPDDKLARLYRDDDWKILSARDPEYVTIRSIRVPYMVFENEDDVTTGSTDLTASRLRSVLERLWELQRRRPVPFEHKSTA
jgi:hypothetical protein